MTWANAKIKRIYVGTNLVYPIWKPSSNTQIYMPLNWNANDYSWNWKNGTASNITWDSWWKWWCASFNGSSSYISFPSLTTTSNTTINCWIKTTMSGTGEIIQLCTSTKSLEIYVSSWKSQLVLYNNWQTAYVVTGTSSLSMDYSNNRIWLHTNWHSNPYSWYIDNLIIESKTWTLDEVQDFYNTNKSNY